MTNSNLLRVTLVNFTRSELIFGALLTLLDLLISTTGWSSLQPLGVVFSTLLPSELPHSLGISSSIMSSNTSCSFFASFFPPSTFISSMSCYATFSFNVTSLLLINILLSHSRSDIPYHLHIENKNTFFLLDQVCPC